MENTNQPSITCPRCGRTSYHPQDIRQRYCGNCHAYHNDLTADDIKALVLSMLTNGATFCHGFDVRERPDFIVGGPIGRAPGSRLVLCQHCGITLYVADVHVFKQFPDLTVLCLKCAATFAANDKAKN